MEEHPTGWKGDDMKRRAALLFAFALLGLGSLAYAAETSAAAPATTPALAGFLASTGSAMSPAPASCAASLSSPAVPELGVGAATPLVGLTCGCGNTLCNGLPANTRCGTGLKCFIITTCEANPKTWQCTCSTEAP
jgi:hypothetical protein